MGISELIVVAIHLPRVTFYDALAECPFPVAGVRP